jgi:ATP-dependent RNA helicase DeaD
MLDMGFREDIERILKAAAPECQKLCFSATMPRSILDLIRNYLREPEIIRVARKEISVPGIEQFYYEVYPHQKSEALCLALDSRESRKCIVFCSTKLGVDELATKLLARGYTADALHGNLNQTQRDRVMNRFRNGETELLVATDVAARGLDINDVDLVINFDIPLDVENYVHRIGRTGRAGRGGLALTFVSPREQYKLRDIMRYTCADIRKANLPTRREVNELKTGRLLDELRSRVENMREAGRDSKKIDPHELMLAALADEETTPLQLASALFKMLLEKEQGFNGPEMEIPPERKDRPAGGARKGPVLKSARRPRYGENRSRRTFVSAPSQSSRGASTRARRP